MTLGRLSGALVKDEDPRPAAATSPRADRAEQWLHGNGDDCARERTDTYQVEQLRRRQRYGRTVTAPSGAKTVEMIGIDGSQQTTYADGGVVMIQYGPDPRLGAMPSRRSRNSITLTTPGGLIRTDHQTRVTANAIETPKQLVEA